MTSQEESDIVYRAIDVLEIEALGFVAVALSPDMPEFEPGSTVTVRIGSPSGAVQSATAVVEYRKRPPIKPVLLRFAGIKKADIPVGSEIRFVGDNEAGA
jgi:hypothetical protein